MHVPGLPDGMFSNRKMQIWVNFGGPCNGFVGIFYGHLVFFTTILYILWTFGMFCGNLVYFMEGLGMKKNGVFYGYVEYIAAIWCIQGPFDNLVAVWYIFPRFGTLNKKSGNPGTYKCAFV
jgi:hypothetical protein